MSEMSGKELGGAEERSGRVEGNGVIAGQQEANSIPPGVLRYRYKEITGDDNDYNHEHENIKKFCTRSEINDMKSFQ